MRVLVEHSISRRMCSSNIKEKVEMFHPVNLTCNLCCFTAANHVQWGNHIIYNHSNIFLPVFPSYESFNDPYLQYQYFHQIQSLLIRPTFNLFGWPRFASLLLTNACSQITLRFYYVVLDF